MNDLLGDPPRLRCLSLYQPWASAIAYGHKRWETRPWATNVRGEFAVHAGKARTAEGEAMLQGYAIAKGFFPDPLPYGAIVALADLTTCIPGPEAIHREPDVCQHAWGDFGTGRFAMALDNIRPLREPYPCLGRQGWFFLERDQAEAVRALAGDPLP